MKRNFMINFNANTNGCGDQRPQETNGASPKSQRNRNNHLTSEKGADKNKSVMRNISISLFTILCVAVFISCEKQYSASNIEDIIKIRELVVDADCSKGVAFSGSYSNYYGDNPSSGTYYCDEWGTGAMDANDIEDIMGTIISAEYNRNKKIAKIKTKTAGWGYGSGGWYKNEGEWIWTFYTKSKH